MPAYIIVFSDITDPGKFEDYKAAAPATIAAHGGRYLARGGAMDVLEGASPQDRVTLVEFPSMEAVRAWHDSPEYQAARKLRDDAAVFDMIVTEGI